MKLNVQLPRVKITPLAVKSFTAAYFRSHRNRPATQEKFLFSHIKKHHDTAFGTLYNLSNARTIGEFQDAIPLQHYETMYPWIERCLRGEKHILLRGKIDRFATSSGTTGKNKYIPVTKTSLRTNHYRAGSDLMMYYAKNNPSFKVWQGHCLGIGGGFSRNPFTGKKNVGYISAIIQKEMPLYAKLRKQPKSKISYLADRHNKVEQMIKATRKKNITMITAQPSWGSAYLEKLVAYTGAKNVFEIWPHFELFIWGGMSIELYKPIFQRLFPGNQVRYYQAYNASEGFFAVQHENDRDDMLLLVEHAVFYEFIPFENYLRKDYSVALTLDQVEIGKPYVIVITNNAGLWRYVLGDVIEFTGTEPHTIKITGRTKYYIDVAGECTPLQPLDEALRKTAEHFHGSIAEYTIGPSPMTKANGGHYDVMLEWLHEPSVSEEEFAAKFDEFLCSEWSYYYDERHDTHMLQAPKAHFAPKGTFYTWMETRGKLGGQHKVPKVSNNRQILEELTHLI